MRIGSVAIHEAAVGGRTRRLGLCLAVCLAVQRTPGGRAALFHPPRRRRIPQHLHHIVIIARLCGEAWHKRGIRRHPCL